ncbi:SDR family NAD(P)-dependent oxidoreductase [Mucilaginibacter galii]|uniref:Short-chain dehydrogenase n=1 Tax=Mucilaginibacter galii TaxID=2005073 RepID=A0A917J9F0_9SPHI|nr:SDR family NAD(P)-dependent oxidoreductase [Mucilaginibacter galii]GGI51069.1 short-chain dehydrogenase [Mucilaginibacter galii]
MARIFITGSADGLGQMAAKILVGQGHGVVLHARNEKRGREAMAAVPGAETVLSADLSVIAEMKKLAGDVNALGAFDAVIHNAALGYQEQGRGNTPDGLPSVFAVNSLAPYVLTCLIKQPQRLVYMSSGLHTQGDVSLKDLTWKERRWSGYAAYADSKLHDLILSLAVARHWPDVLSNAVEPGWVATKMGGPNAPDNLQKGAETQSWLAVSEDVATKVSGRYFYHQREKNFLSGASDEGTQERFLKGCEDISGINFAIKSK